MEAEQFEKVLHKLFFIDKISVKSEKLIMKPLSKVFYLEFNFQFSDRFRSFSLIIILTKKFFKIRIKMLEIELLELPEINRHLEFGAIIHQEGNFFYQTLLTNSIEDASTALNLHINKLIQNYQKIVLSVLNKRIKNITLSDSLSEILNKSCFYDFHKVIPQVPTTIEENEENKENSSDSSYDIPVKKVKIVDGIHKIDPTQLKTLKAIPEIWQHLEISFFYSPDLNEYIYDSINCLGHQLLKRKPKKKLIPEMINFLMLLYSHNYRFQKFPDYLFLVSVKNLKIISFKFALIFYEETSTVTLGPNEYKIEMLKSLGHFIFKYRPENLNLNYIKEDLIDISRLEYPNIVDESQKIGEGGFTEIFKNKINDKTVALKISKACESLASSKKFEKYSISEANKNALKELKILKQMSSPRIVKALGLINFNKCLCLVLEFVEGKPLKKLTNLGFNDKLKIIEKCSSALDDIHQANIIHCDIKPSNILVDDEKNVKIIDFGLAEHERFRKVRTGFTQFFAHPEQVLGFVPGKKADIWAFGMTLYYFFTEKYPFYHVSQGINDKNQDDFYLNVILGKYKLNFDGIQENSTEIKELIQDCTQIKIPENFNITDRIKKFLQNILNSKIQNDD